MGYYGNFGYAQPPDAAADYGFGNPGFGSPGCPGCSTFPPCPVGVGSDQKAENIPATPCDPANCPNQNNQLMMDELARLLAQTMQIFIDNYSEKGKKKKDIPTTSSTDQENPSTSGEKKAPKKKKKKRIVRRKAGVEKEMQSTVSTHSQVGGGRDRNWVGSTNKVTPFQLVVEEVPQKVQQQNSQYSYCGYYCNQRQRNPSYMRSPSRRMGNYAGGDQAQQRQQQQQCYRGSRRCGAYQGQHYHTFMQYSPYYSSIVTRNKKMPP